MSVGEYQANMNGLNMFFGAVLGFVLAGTERLTNFQFGVILLCLSSVVIAIQYISSSRHRTAYAGLALVYATAFPEIMELALRGKDLVPDKIRMTLIVWTVMAIVIEFWARDKEKAPQP